MGEKRAGAALLQAIRPAICSKIDKKLRGFMHSEENSAATFVMTCILSGC